MPPKPEQPPDAAPAERGSILKALRSESRPVDLDFVRRRQSRARMITTSTLERIVAELVENVVLEGRGEQWLEAGAIGEQAGAEFRRLLAEHQKALDEKGQAERDRERLMRQISHLRGELDRQTERLETERFRDSPDVRISFASIEEMELRMRRLLGRLLHAPGTGAAAGTAAQLDPLEMKEAFAQILHETLDRERERAAVELSAAGTREVDRLERRVAKLKHTLSRTEGALANLASDGAAQAAVGAAALPAGVRPPTRPEDERKKQRLLKTLFVNNLKLRGRELEPDDLDNVVEGQLLDVSTAARPSARE